MSFWDNVKKFAQPYADEDEYDDYDEELDDYEEEVAEPAPAPRSGRRMPSFGSAPVAEPAPEFNAPPVNPAPVVNTGFNGHVLHNANKQEEVLFNAKAFDDAAKAADELRDRKAIILNMENVDKALTRRVVDFLSGCVYALNGKVKKIAQCTYLFCPHNMDIVGDLESFRGEVESYI